MESMQSNNVFQITEKNLALLQEKINKINKRAAKLSMPAVNIIIDSEEFVPDPNFVNEQHAPLIKVFNIHIEGTGPKIENYRFIGVLDHKSIPGEIIVKPVPGEHIPEHFYHADRHCDHCNKIRTRNHTFILVNELDNTYLQIGRQCIKDFIGHDPKAIASYFSGIQEIQQQVSSFSNIHGDNSCWVFDNKQVLSPTIAVIRKYGWVSKTAAFNNPDKYPTSALVADLLAPSSNEQQRKRKQQIIQDLSFDPQDTIVAEQAIEFILNQQPSSEYIHNVQTIAKSQYCPYNLIPIWSSLINFYQKSTQKKSQELANEFVGTIGETIELKVKVNFIENVQSYFGVSTLVKFTDEQNHLLVWFANTKVNFKVGDEITIKGKVKKHEQYKQQYQTIITRVKVSK